MSLMRYSTGRRERKTLSVPREKHRDDVIAVASANEFGWYHETQAAFFPTRSWRRKHINYFMRKRRHGLSSERQIR